MSLASITGALLAFIARLVTGAQGHWKGCPPMAEQRIYFANHQSHLDWVLIWAALPHELRTRTRPIAARDYWAGSPFRRWLTTEVFHAVYVDRSRSAKGEPMPFKSGLYHLAQQFPGVQLVPAWIDNVQRVMPKGEVVPVPVLCTVTFGAPLRLEEGEDKRVFLERAREAVIAQRPAGSGG